MAIHVKSAILSAAYLIGALSIVCSVGYWLAPTGTLSLFNAIFHGVDLQKIAIPTMTFGNFLASFVVVEILTIVIVGAYSLMYNKLSRG